MRNGRIGGGKQMTAEEKLKEHHIWCNRRTTPAETCKMCEGFNRDYPIANLVVGRFKEDKNEG